MKVEIYGSFAANGEIKTVELDDNFQGITTHDEPHSGQYRVKEISNVRIYADHISILVTPLDSDPINELSRTKPEELLVAHSLGVEL